MLRIQRYGNEGFNIGDSQRMMEFGLIGHGELQRKENKKGWKKDGC